MAWPGRRAVARRGRRLVEDDADQLVKAVERLEGSPRVMLLANAQAD